MKMISNFDVLMNICKEIICFVFLIIFLLSKNFFLQQHENIIKSNNTKKNCMNQILRLPLLKYTHTQREKTC